MPAQRPVSKILRWAAVLALAQAGWPSAEGQEVPKPSPSLPPALDRRPMPGMSHGMGPMPGMPTEMRSMPTAGRTAMPRMADTPGMDAIMRGPAALEEAGLRPAHAPESPVGASTLTITLDELEAIALRSNPTLIQARAQIDASAAKSFQAGLFPNPIIGYASDQIGIRGTPGETQGAFVTQEIFRGGKLRLSRAKYRQEAVEAELQARAQVMRIINGVRIRYYEILAAHRSLEVQKHLLRNYEEMARTTRELVNVGQANRPELLQVQVNLQRRKVGVAKADNEYRKSWEMLTTLLGEPGCIRGSLADTLDVDTPAIGFEEALATIYKSSPQLHAARAEVVRDEITVQRERAQPSPNVFVAAVTGFNFETNNQTAGVQIGINPPVLNANQGTVREAMAEVSRARAEVARLELSLRQRLAEVYADYQTALTAVGLYRAETLPMARESYELMRVGYLGRRVPWAELVVVERTYSDVVEEYIEALRTLRQSEVEIRGMLLTGGLDEPPPPAGLGGHIDATPQPR
jgi:cobalt-zinc-cadmium efflux system outer membrane protein